MNYSKKFTASLIVALLFAGTVHAGDLPEGGSSLIVADALDALQVEASDASATEQKVVDVTDQTFKKASEFAVTGEVANPWDVQYVYLNQSAIKKGDVLHIRFYARCIKGPSNTAKVGVVFEQAGEPYQKSLDLKFTAGAEWTLIDVPFTAKSEIATGAARFGIRMGYSGQTIQLGGIQLLDFGQSFDKSKLPVVKPTK